MDKSGSLGSECVAELIGTFVLVFFGTGSVFVAVLSGAFRPQPLAADGASPAQGGAIEV